MSTVTFRYRPRFTNELSFVFISEISSRYGYNIAQWEKCEKHTSKNKKSYRFHYNQHRFHTQKRPVMVVLRKLTSEWFVSEEMFQKGLLKKEENAAFKKKQIRTKAWNHNTLLFKKQDESFPSWYRLKILPNFHFWNKKCRCCRMVRKSGASLLL